MNVLENYVEWFISENRRRWPNLLSIPCLIYQPGVILTSHSGPKMIAKIAE